MFAIYQPEEIYTQHRLEIQEQIIESVRYDLRNRFNIEPGKPVTLMGEVGGFLQVLQYRRV